MIAMLFLGESAVSIECAERMKVAGAVGNLELSFARVAFLQRRFGQRYTAVCLVWPHALPLSMV